MDNRYSLAVSFLSEMNLSDNLQQVLKITELAEQIHSRIQKQLENNDFVSLDTWFAALNSQDTSLFEDELLQLYLSIYPDLSHLVFDDSFQVIGAALNKFQGFYLPGLPNSLQRLLVVDSAIVSLNGLGENLKFLTLWSCDQLVHADLTSTSLRALEVCFANGFTVFDGFPNTLQALTLHGLENLESLDLATIRFKLLDVQGCYNLDPSSLNGVYAVTGKFLTDEVSVIFKESFLFVINPCVVSSTCETVYH